MLDKNSNAVLLEKISAMVNEDHFEPFENLEDVPLFLRSVLEKASLSIIILKTNQSYGYDYLSEEEIMDHLYQFDILTEILEKILSKKAYETFSAQCEYEAESLINRSAIN